MTEIKGGNEGGALPASGSGCEATPSVAKEASSQSGIPDAENMVERITRTICTLNEGGYCECIGESRGCKVGRGEPPEASRCKMTHKAMPLTNECRMACAAIAAMREPTDAMIDAAVATPGMEAASSAMVLHQARGYGFKADAFQAGSPLHQAWRAMIDAASGMPPRENNEDCSRPKAGSPTVADGDAHD